MSLEPREPDDEFRETEELSRFIFLIAAIAARSSLDAPEETVPEPTKFVGLGVLERNVGDVREIPELVL